MQSLFPQRATSQSGSNVLVTFSAGKCQLIPQNGGKFMIQPEPRRGTVTLEKDNDGLTHFCWTDRTTGVREEDQIIFPNEITFKKAKGGKPEDRVYFLQFENSTRYNFFWMQEKSNEKDTEYCNKINEYSNNPAAADAALATSAAAARGGAGAAGSAGGAGQDAWMQMMGLAPPAAGGAAPAAANNPYAQLDLSSLLSQYGATATPAASAQAPANPNTTVGAVATGGAGEGAEEEGEDGDEGDEGDEEGGEGEDDGLNAMEALLSVGALEDPVVTAQLLQYLPQGMQTEEILVETVNSPAFQELYEAVHGTLPEEQVAVGVADMSLHSPRLEVMRQRRVQELIATLTLLFTSDAGSME